MSLKFRDRADAGRQLAGRLSALGLDDPIVLALPRGGVPVGFEIAEELNARLDVILVRKLGAPGFSELGIGAVAEGASPQFILNDDAIARLRPSAEQIEDEKIRQLEVLDMRRKIYRQGRPPPEIAGRTVILVDDGIATGGTVLASLKALATSGASRVILAVPVAPADMMDRLTAKVDDVVALTTPAEFRSVADHYDQFDQLSDNDVIELLLTAAERHDRNRDRVEP